MSREATQVTTWKRQAIDNCPAIAVYSDERGLTGVFYDNVRRAEDNEAEIKELHAKIGKLAVLHNSYENDFLSQGLKYYRQGLAQQCPERR